MYLAIMVRNWLKEACGGSVILAWRMAGLAAFLSAINISYCQCGGVAYGGVSMAVA